MGYVHPVGPVELGGLLGYAHSGYERDDQIGVRLDELAVMATLQWTILRGLWFRPTLALDAGGSWVWQVGELPGGEEQRRFQMVFRYRVRLGLEVSLSGRFLLGLWGCLPSRAC